MNMLLSIRFCRVKVNDNEYGNGICLPNLNLPSVSTIHVRVSSETFPFKGNENVYSRRGIVGC